MTTNEKQELLKLLYDLKTNSAWLYMQQRMREEMTRIDQKLRQVGLPQSETDFWRGVASAGQSAIDVLDKCIASVTLDIRMEAEKGPSK